MGVSVISYHNIEGTLIVLDGRWYVVDGKKVEKLISSVRGLGSVSGVGLE